jgi:hypothetical protein
MSNRAINILAPILIGLAVGTVSYVLFHTLSLMGVI